MSQYMFNKLYDLGVPVKSIKLYETTNSYALATKYDDSINKYVKDKPIPTHKYTK